MTTLTLRKHNKDDLQFLIDCEMQVYAIAVQGRQLFYKTGMQPEFSEYRKYGAITQISESLPLIAMQKMKEHLDNGATLCTTITPIVNNYVAAFYVVKSPAEQAQDAKAIAAEVTAKYKADIEAHNDMVYAQEAKALAEEEARVAAQLKAEDAARAAADLDKRVRERMRGMK